MSDKEKKTILLIHIILIKVVWTSVNWINQSIGYV